jgi:heat shock protein HslJ
MTYGKMLPAIITLIAAVALAGCAMLPGTPQADDLAGSEWHLVSLDSASLIPGTRINLSFSDGQAGGNSGCNSYGGAYTAGGGSISVSEIAMTEMACLEPQGVMDQEQAYLAALAAAARYRLSDDRLEMDDAAGNTRLIFARGPADAALPAQLTGATWYLVSFIEADVASSLLADTVITLNATEAAPGLPARFSGSAGCNSYSAFYSFDGAKLNVGLVSATRMFCAQPQGVMEQEQRYAEWLQAVKTHSFDRDNLRLETDDGRVLLFAPAPLAPAGPSEPSGGPAWVAPPLAALTVGGQRQEAGLGSYCWSEPAGAVPGPGVCADMVGIITPHDALPAPGATFTASFEFPMARAPSELVLRVMPAGISEFSEGDYGRAWRPVESMDHALPLEREPEIELSLEPGLYIFSVFGRWTDHGDASYGWMVDVP